MILEEGKEYMSFKVAFKTVPSNVKIFNHFKNYCSNHTQNSYLLGISELLLKATILDKLVAKELKDGIEGTDRTDDQEELYD